MAPPSTFASAAAGINSPSTPLRPEISGDRAPRRTNGLTQTFRRPSLATTAPSSNALPRESNTTTTTAASSTNAPAAVYVPPHRNGSYVDTRYSKNQLLDLFRAQADGAGLDELNPLFMPGWEPGVTNGQSSGAWNRRDDQGKDNVPGPEVCWDKDGSVAPIGLVDMDDEEKEVFTSVNSPLKPPTQASKEATAAREGTNRKVSVSQVTTPGAFGVNSPSTSTRPGARRQQTQEAYPFPNSPSVSKTSRDDPRAASPPPALTRSRTDFKDQPAGIKTDTAEDRPAEESTDATRTPFGTLKRAPTGPLSAGVGGPSSPWASSPQTGAAFSPMGAFGNFAVGANVPGAGTPTDKRPGLAGGRAESRFKGLMSKETADEGRSLTEKPSLGNIGGAAWRASDQAQTHLPEEPEEDDIPTGSAALGGGDDSPVHERDRPEFGNMGTPSRQPSRDKFGFGAFGMTSDPSTFRGLMQHQQQHEQYHGTPQPRAQQHQQQGQTGNEPMSPTDTNPYKSPEQHGADPDDLDNGSPDMKTSHLPGLGGFMGESISSMGGFSAGIPNLGRAPAAPPSDRSQTSSVGPQRGFQGLSGLGGLGALPGLGGSSTWGSGQGSIGTPTRERPGLATNFGDNVFGSGAEIQSPSLAGLGHSNFFGNTPGAGRGPSRLGSFLPAGMQEQIRSASSMQHYGEEGSEHGEYSNSGGPARDTDSPFRAQAGSNIPFGQFGTSNAQTPSIASAGQDPIGARSIPPPAVSSSASNQPPAAQQKTMVMPDRMRWIYRDPQGNTQGPWSGLEMHDWYKAGFFSPELLVKKYEDPDYEPLAQLIRRIGNSREPFLVPQIGIPHGTSTVNPPAAWNGPLATPASGAQPPFANSFPSFGTTLTADQQNALERRKQEEQYLMARQKEHLAQQQIAQKFQLQGQYGMLPQQLHHHSSAQSLHSQPSFGSITSPSSYQPAAHPGPAQGSQNVPGFFDNSFRNGPIGGLGAGIGGGLSAVGAGVDMLGNIREEELPGMLDRLNIGRRQQGAFGGIGQPLQHDQQVAQMLNDRQRLQQEQTQKDAAQRVRQDQPAGNERFQQFQGLQPEAQADPFNVASEGVIGKPSAPQTEQQQQQQQQQQQSDDAQSQQQAEERQDEQIAKSIESALGAEESQTEHTQQTHQPQEQLSLTEQVQKAQSAKQSPVPQSVWAKVDTTLPQPFPQPFPPAPSQSPLPAPAAQRNRSNMADALHAESRSRSQTPSVDTPSASIAPWAKEPAEAPRGPSLKEIQEAEAKVAAEQEAVAAEARRAALERELLAQAQNIAPAPGLPSSSTWASANASPATPASATASAWAKAATKPAATPTSTKTLAQIQKEEEARKKRQLAVAAAAAQANATATAAVHQAAVGKRYADLAGKTASPSPSPVIGAPGGAWTTVGASGKVKTPAPAPTPVASRAVSAAGVPAVKKPVVTKPTTSGSGVTVNANEEFKKWAVNELKHDLQKGTQAEDFVANLLALGNEAEIVMHAVHSMTSTIDSRHFAEEFLRRRKLADKGIVDTTTKSSSSPANAGASSTGGWSEVAKKGPSSANAAGAAAGAGGLGGGLNKGLGLDEGVVAAGSFKVVAPKKKAGKR
ncbi:hypothetical protein AAFC00_002259 [Neodothiora populina]|uniref:GYF domain-containing protein n=1 Tax=Neodothiora populina TaxID=2781224 RepID=A0ABR3PGW8_9PEZI